MTEPRMLIRARNRTVGIAGGRIVEPTGAFDVVLDLPHGDVRPGLINAHDHLHRNHYGRLGRPPYANAYRWAHDIQRRHRARIAEGRRRPRREALLAGAWKNLFAGVTTVVHHDAWEVDFDRDFPVRVVRIDNADSLGMTPTLPGSGRAGPFCLHLAEGTDPAAADEVRALAARGLIGPALIAVHGVGIDADGIERLRAAGAALVWCPSSNLFLLGATAPAALLAAIDILLGSDSLLTGAGDLLDELRTARSLGGLSDDRLEAAVGTLAARRLGIAVPTLAPGAAADLVVLTAPLLAARAADVVLVMVGGEPRVADPDVACRLPDHERGRTMTIGSVVRWTSDHGHEGMKGATG